MFLWPAVAAVDNTRYSASVLKLAIWLYGLFLVLIIGLRFKVGVDWDLYLENMDFYSDFTWVEAIVLGDPAYTALNKLATSMGFGIWIPNLVCAIAFVSGFFAFCRKMPNPWLALTVGIPYMAIVMTMNYSRQGGAFGFELWALVSLLDGRIRRYVFFIVVAALFHKTAIMMLPLAVLAGTRNRTWLIIWMGIASLLAYVAFIAEHQQSLVENYIGEAMDSQGAAVRVAMNAVPAMLFLFMRSRFEMLPDQRQFWTRISIIVLLFIPALVLSPSSTAVDRIALYFMPIQLMVFSHLPYVVRKWKARQVATLLVVGGYALVMAVWFNYTYYYSYWVPYRFYPFEFL